jgi:hypothetical protein
VGESVTVGSVRRLALLLVLGSGLALGTTALAREGGGDDVVIAMQRGCLPGTRLTIRIEPPEDAILSPVHIRVGRREAVHLTGVTQDASVTVRINRHARVSVNGETTGGRRFGMSREIRRCAPQPPPPQTVSGGGEG